MINVLKIRETMVRDMADKKKCVEVFAVKKEINPVKVQRERVTRGVR